MKIKTFILIALVLMGVQSAYTQTNFLNDNWVYIGAKAGVNIPFYEHYYNDIENPKIGFNASFQVFVPIIQNFGVQTELQYFSDELSYSQNTTVTVGPNSYSGKADVNVELKYLTIPILARYDIVKNIFKFSGLAGFYFTIPILKYEQNINLSYAGITANPTNSYNYLPSHGILIGFDFGVKVGPGNIFMDIRYGVDMNNIQIKYPNSNVDIKELHKSYLPITIGYEIGIIKR